MSKTYELAPAEVKERADKLISQYHHDIENAAVRIDYLFATSDSGNAVMLHGYPCLAVVRIVNLKDRAKKNADAEITIDAEAYKTMTDAQKDGLLDHELHHLIVKRDKDGGFDLDDLYRPKLKLRKHDWQMGWFEEIARRHGPASPEVYQAQILWDNAGQAFFPMLLQEGTMEQIARRGSDGFKKLTADGSTTIEISSGGRKIAKFAKGEAV
jgi:hypothetical protein